MKAFEGVARINVRQLTAMAKLDNTAPR